jgi:putative ABC transport system permease protein
VFGAVGFLRMNSLGQDIRFSLRLMRQRPGMTFLVIAALVVGIGINSAVFTVVNSVVIRPLPIPDPDRLTIIRTKSQQFPNIPVSYPEYLDWKKQSHSFQHIATLRFMGTNLTGYGPPEHLKGIRTSASFFKVLGLAPAIGRDFTEDDDRPGANRTVIISHGLWKRRFGGDPTILGKSVVLNDQPFTVIGVAPANQFYILGFDLWVPTQLFLDEGMANRNNRYDLVIARLYPSVTQEQAQVEMETISRRLAAEYPQSEKDILAEVVGVARMLKEFGQDSLKHILTASSLILLLAAVNVVTVFLASAVERRKELSLRMALGAGRAVLLRQFLVQGIIFAGISGVIGLVVGRVGVAFLVSRFPYAVGRFQEITLDGRVILFTLGTTLAVSLFSCLLPALYTASLNINSELKGDWSWPALSRYRFIGQSALIVFEVSLAVALSLVSGLLMKSLYEVEKVDLGFNPERVLSFQVSLPSPRYNGADRISGFYALALQNIRSLPGVRSASAVSTLPLTGSYHFINLEVEADRANPAAKHPYVDSSSVLPGYFEALRCPVLYGRDFTGSDRAGSLPVAIVDDVLAARMWPGQSALGKRIRLADEGDKGPPWREVVGVVRQVKHYGPEQEVRRFQVYVPLFQQPTPTMSFVIDFQTGQDSTRSAVEKVIYGLDKDIPLDNVQTMEDLFVVLLSSRKVSVLMWATFAAIGIMLGLVGIYGVVSNSVVRMRREIAIRMALGATVRNAIVLVTKLGLLSTLAGVAIGSGLVLCFTKVLSKYLFGVRSLDLPIYFFSALLIIMLASIASLIPAQRLLRLNPQEVLKE